MDESEMKEKIRMLKEKKNAVILAHNYCRPEIYDVADFVGDSLELARMATSTDADIIVFCGVDFMGEAAKILNPDKKVLVPVEDARCPMAAMATAEAVRKAKEENPGAVVVSYINTSAAVKAESDICCTSANAEKIVNAVESDKIIFVPDRNLGMYSHEKSGKNFVFWEGYCYVHDSIMPCDIARAREEYPHAKVIAHPECRPEVLSMADAICSTSQMITYARDSEACEFIVATEDGMCERLAREVPAKSFHSIGGVCADMKKTRLEDVVKCLEDEKFEIVVDDKVAEGARKALERMVEKK